MKKKICSIISLVLTIVLTMSLFMIIPVNAYVMDETDIDTELFSTTLDLQYYEWNQDVHTAYFNSSLNGTFVDKNGIVYDISINGKVATITGIVAPHGTKTITIPKVVNLYSIEAVDADKGGLHKFSTLSEYDKNVYAWESPSQLIDVVDDYGNVHQELEYLYSAIPVKDTFTVVSVGTIFSDISNTVEEIILPSTVEYLSDSAFSGNVFVKKIYAPGVKRLGSSCFEGCWALEYAYIPNLLYMESSVFYDCYNLKAFEFNKTLNIGDNAFYNCTSLKYIDLPITLQKIGSSVFDKCENLEKVNIPKNIAINTIEQGTFAHCTSLKETIIPYEIVILKSNAFEHCDKLMHIDLRKTNIAGIEGNTFFGCLNLQYALLPETLLDFNSAAFDSCTSLRYVYFSNEMTEYELENLKASSLASKVVLKKDVTGPVATVSGSKDAFVKHTISSKTSFSVFSQVDIASATVTCDNVPVEIKSGYSTVYGYKTKNISFTADKAGDYVVTVTDVLDNKRTFTVKYEKTVMGDADGDKTVTAADARLALRQAVGLENLAQKVLTIIDVDKDGKVTAADARLILRASVGLEKFA